VVGSQSRTQKDQLSCTIAPSSTIGLNSNGRSDGWHGSKRGQRASVLRSAVRCYRPNASSLNRYLDVIAKAYLTAVAVSAVEFPTSFANGGAYVPTPRSPCASSVHRSDCPLVDYVSNSPTDHPIVRDQEALAILNQTVSASGGASAIAAIQDYTESGTITYFWADGQDAGGVLLRGLGATDFRLDATLADGPQSWAVLSGQGTIKSISGVTDTIPYVDALSLSGYTFSLPQILNLLSDTSISIVSSGQVQLNGSSAYEIRVQRTFSPQMDPDGSVSEASRQTIFVDATSFQILQVDSLAHQGGGAAASYVRSVQFSNYKAVNGVSVPFQIKETISGRKTLAIQLTTVTFNSGLTDSDFLL